MNKTKKIETQDRLQEIMELKRPRVADIAEGTGLTAQTIYNYLSRQYEPPIDKIQLLAKYFQVSELWLLGYDVPMEKEPEPKEIAEKVYIVANTLREDFRLHTATTDKELAEAVYAQLKNQYIGTDFEADLKILEFRHEDSLELLNGHLNDVTEECLRNSLTKEYPYNLLVKLAGMSQNAVNIPTERLSLDIEAGLTYAISTLLKSEREVLQLRYQERLRLREIGERWDCTHQNVTEVEQRALAKLLSDSLLGYIRYGKKGYENLLAEQEKQAAPDEGKASILIQDLNLATLSLNALTKKGYQTVADLVPLTKKEISLIRKLGPRSICDVAQALENIGVCNTAWSEFLHKDL